MSVAKMKDGKRWYVFVRWKDFTGETHQHKKEGFERKADAKAYETEYLAKHAGSTDMTVQSLFELYIADCQARLRATTVKSKTFLFERLILPYLGNLQISKIASADIRNWQNTIMTRKTSTGKAYAPTYLKTANNQISALFNFGVKYYGVKSNPCQVVGSMGRKNADAMKFWTVDEFNRFIASMTNRPRSLVMISILFWTGMRKGEMLALTPADFNFDVPSVSITKSYTVQTGTPLILPPKTPKSIRTILIPQKLADMVQGYIKTIYGIEPNDRIFENVGKPFLSREIDRGCAETGVKRIRVHDLRHSHASLLIELGYSPLLIAERLGHENIETTLRTYSHLYPNKQSELVEHLNSIQNCYDFATHDFVVTK